MKKLFLSIAFIFGLAIILVPSETNAQVQECVTPPTDTGTVTLSVDVQGGTYKVWSRMKIPSANTGYILKVGDTCAKSQSPISSTPTNTWVWIDYYGGVSQEKNIITLSPGTHAIILTGVSDGVGVDKILLTQDLSCTPTGLSGDNCVAETPDNDAPVITGVRAYDITGTTTKVTWQLDEYASGQVDYRPVGSSSWQSTTFQTCCQYNMHIQSISGLTNGTTYEYRVKSTDAAGNESISQVCRFTAGGAASQDCGSSAPTPTNTPTNSPTPTTTNTPTPTPTGVPDTTPPVISNPRVEEVTATTAKFRWELNEYATGKTEYRPLGTSTWILGGNETSFKYDYHIQSLSGFTNGTTYEYRVSSTDASGNGSVSQICRFVAGGAATQTCSSTPTSTPTPTITSTPTPTATPVPNATLLRFQTVKLHGIGSGGDNTNPNLGGNQNPLRTTRNFSVELLDASGNTLPAINSQITFNSGSGVFSGDITLPTSVASGNYLVKVKSPQYLKKQATGIINITKSTINNIPEISLTTGDIDNDNALTILDYNILVDCYSDLLPARNCDDATKKQSADLSDDGNVNANDYNLFLRELSVASGD